MTVDLVIVGCSGHGREVFDIIRAVNAANPAPAWRVVGFVDDDPTPENLARVRRLGAEHLGPCWRLADTPTDTAHVIGLGDPRVRAAVGAKLQALDRPAATLVHPTATVGQGTTLGDGVVLFAGARVTTDVTLGRHVHVNQNATIGHDSVLGDFVSVHPLAAISGSCHLEEAALVGTTAAVLQFRRVGARAIVAAGACVVKDVMPGAVVNGVPAR